MEAFQLRLWDGRIGRWLSPDPKHQYASPYLGMGNNPISRIDPDGGDDNDYGLDANGKVTLIKTTTDTFDRLIAGNGDVIDGNIQKGILWSGMDLGSNVSLISLSQPNIYGDKVRMSEVNDLLFRVSVYEQKEISWGKFNSFSGSDSYAVVNPYLGNKSNEATSSVGASFIRNGVYYIQMDNYHTHPSFADGYGFGNPSPNDKNGSYQNAARSFIISRECQLTRYDKNEIFKNKTLSPSKLYREEWISKDYVKTKWGWGKKF